MTIGNKEKTISDVTDFVNTRSLEIVNQYGNTGTVTNITAGTGLSSNPLNGISAIGTISLDADISDLNDVNFNLTSLVADQILSYNGSSWINKTYPGLDGSSIAFTDLTDVYISPNNILTNAKDNLFVVNSSGTSLIAKPLTDFVDTITDGYAIDTTRNNSTVNIEFNSGKINLVSNTFTGNDHILGHDSSGNQAVRQTFQTTPLSLFLNDENFVKTDELYPGTAIDITDNGSSIIIGVCTLGLGVSTGAITGVLAINQGGTGGTTSVSARSNLNLEYNVDVLPVNGPSFTGLMQGSNITMLNDGFGLSLISGGTSYTSGPLILVNPNNSLTIDTGLTFTQTGGIITTPTSSGVSLKNINLLDYGTSYAVFGTSGISAYYQVTPNNINLFFGGSSLGFRDNNGILEVKTTSAGNWNSFYPLEFNDLTNVNTSSLGTSDFLIYNGSNWVNTNLYGDSNFNVSYYIAGTSTILQITPQNNTINPLTIQPGTINSTEFGYLNGVTSNIQTQLDSKLGPSPNNQTPNNGDMIVHDGSCWVLTSVPSAMSGYILGVSGSYNPGFGYLYNFFGASSDFDSSDWNNSYFINVESGSCPGYRVNLGQFLNANLLSGTSSGLNFTAGNQLKLDIRNLGTSSDFPNPSNDFIPYYNNNLNDDKKISIDNLASQMTGNGLRTNGKELEVGDLTEALTLYNYGHATSLPSASLNKNSIAGVSDASGSGSSLVYSNGTSWYYISLGIYI